MKKVAVVGASGYIGSAIFKELEKNKSFHTRAVTRKNYAYWKKQEFDIVINSAMPSARYWAEQNPRADFVETVKKTEEIVSEWKYKKFIQISTISARTELDLVYGRHKAAAEKLCDPAKSLIVRLTSTYADSLSKGALIDIINKKKVYVDKKSRYGFSSLDFVTMWISNNLERKGLVEVGARNSVSLEEIVKYFKLAIEFDGKLDVQEVKNPSANFPDARNVLTFLKNKIHNS